MPTKAELDEQTVKDRAWNDSLPHVMPSPSGLNPSGLVPYDCLHGVPVKPARYAHTKWRGVWLDDEGNEKPPYGGNSWGRARFQISGTQCIVCKTGEYPADFFTTADGVELEHA